MNKLCAPVLLCLLISATCLFGTLHTLTCRKQVDAVEGAPMELLCQSEIPIDSCTFDFPGFKKIKAYAGVKNQNYEFVGNYVKGECGIRFSAMKRELEGQVTIEVTFPDEDVPAQAEINVTMLYPPAPDDIHVVSNENNFVFNEGDEMIFSCFCDKSNPLSNISLQIGDEEPCVGSYLTSINASKKAEISDFDKKVVCVVHHPLLGDEGFTSSNLITILQKPIAISKSIHKFGKNISINVTVSAFPKPHTISWMRNNGSYLTLENSWLIPVEDTHCIWEVGVNMSEITEDDLKRGFELTIANSEGQYTTKVIPEANKESLINIVTVMLIIAILCIAACLFASLFKRTKKIDKLMGGNEISRENSPQPLITRFSDDDDATCKETLAIAEREKLTSPPRNESVYSDANKVAVL